MPHGPTLLALKGLLISMDGRMLVRPPPIGQVAISELPRRGVWKGDMSSEAAGASHAGWSAHLLHLGRRSLLHNRYVLTLALGVLLRAGAKAA